MTTWRVSTTIFRKDLLAERRTKEVFTAILLFGFTVAVAFTFAFEPTAEEARAIAGGLLWLAFLFSAVLGLNRAFARETANDCLRGLRLVPADPGAIYLGKLLSNVLFMVAAELVLLPIFGVFFNLNLWARPGWLLLILLLGTWGLASLGTIFSAVSANTRMQELMLPLLLLPLTVPVLIAAIESTAILLSGRPISEAGLWFRLLAGFDIIFTVLCWLLFGYVIEE
ncbi:MAG TPA: heme exporter protein CcmB [Candidatus Acidoferrales bacterium]|nr:heme exporter protein CcmB [Candidatus Acidoferrales bacterium]